MVIGRRGLIGGATAALAGAFVLAKVSTGDDKSPEAERSPEAQPSPATPKVPATPARVYLGSFTSDGGRGITVATANPANGILKLGATIKGVVNPSWLDISPDGSTLYAVSEESAGTVRAFDLTDKALPARGRPVRTGNSPTHLAVHPLGRHLLTSLYGGGAVVVHPIAADGSVGAATTRRSHRADGTARAHQVVFDPSGRFALSVDLGIDSVYVESFDPASGALGAAKRARFATGSGPRHLAFHPNGAFAYVANELDSTITICRFSQGRLTPGASVGSRAAGASGKNFPSEILTSPDGRFVYIANRGDDTIGVFATGNGGGSLKLVATPSCGGEAPRHMAFAPGGRFLYVANQDSDTVAWLPVDAQTGVPGAARGTVPVPAAANVRFAAGASG